jgi:hypothetical protein
MNEFLKNNHPCELDNKELNNFNTTDEIQEIKLFNRDGADLRLVSEDGLLWRLKVDIEHKYILEYMRYGLEKDNRTICMIDPSGGPYMTIGTKIGQDFVIDAFVELDGECLIHTNRL